MKAKSMKLRMLITLHAIMKYSDENHRMNSIKLNEYLKPYGLDCSNRVLGDTVRVMREFGVDVHSKGEWDNQGIWIKDRPLQNDKLNALIFAVTTNPYIGKSESERILKALTPLVTVYQEPLLNSYIDKSYETSINANTYQKYIVICDAISSKRRLRYQIPVYQYDYDKKEIVVKNQWPTLFTPKCLYQYDEKLYMIGYNHNDKRTDAVDLELISEIKIAFKHKDPKAYETEQILASIDPIKCIKGKIHHFFYEGDIVFKCRGQYVGELYKMFGPPSASVEKDKRCRYTYSVSNARLDTKKLNTIAGTTDHNIRIVGPSVLIDKIHDYYSETSEKITNSIIKKEN